MKVITFLSILAFMVAYYAGGGVVAILALIINIFLLLGAMASLGTVLTLPGIAGIVLTIGMAVDANVIIYERIREELRAGLGLRDAIQAGFKHAASAIIDGNLTTFIVGIALAVFGLGPIKGFAIVLMLGIATTLFTGILVSRMMVEYWTEKKGRSMSFSYPCSYPTQSECRLDGHPQNILCHLSGVCRHQHHCHSGARIRPRG